MTTGYKIAENGFEYKQAHEFVKMWGVEGEFKLSFPTILAIDGDEIVGVLGTNVEHNYILAGPLVVKGDKQRFRTILRLCEMYDLAMRTAGVQSYIFCTELSNKRWLEYIDTVLGLVPYSYKDGRAWFLRDLKG